jgi:flagellar motor switch protein FliN/FliY
MANDPDIIGQNEIENLLQQARNTDAARSEKSRAPSAPSPGPVRQEEIDSVLSGLGLGSARGTAAVAEGTPAAAATISRSTSPRGSASPQHGGDSFSPVDDVHFLLDQAEQAIASVDRAPPAPDGAMPFRYPDLGGSPPSDEKATVDLLSDVELNVKIELGRTHMYLEDVLKLRRGSVVTLDKLAGDPVDIYVNGRLIARGEVLVLNDNFCVRVAELITGDES